MGTYYEEYVGATITNIRRVNRHHNNEIIYAEIHASDGRLLVAATLEKCVELLEERLPIG